MRKNRAIDDKEFSDMLDKYCSKMGCWECPKRFDCKYCDDNVMPTKHD